MRFLTKQANEDILGTVHLPDGGRLIPVGAKRKTPDEVRAFKRRVAKRRKRKGYR